MAAVKDVVSVKEGEAEEIEVKHGQEVGGDDKVNGIHFEILRNV